MTIRRRRRWISLAVILPIASGTLSASALSTSGGPAFTKTETITRDHLVDGADQIVDTRTVKVTVSSTENLRDRQAVKVTWTGAHPTGGLVADRNSAPAAREEYPVVVMECRGVDSPTAPAAKQLSPETCWTQSPDERFIYSQSGFVYPVYRMDRYASTEDRAIAVNQPNPLPAACPAVAAPHWVPFVAADGKTYAGGRLGCGGLAPEAANGADSLQPGNTTYGVADAQGNGETDFVIQTADSNASLGCSATVACSLVIIPVMGISCDAAGTANDAPDRGLPVANRPSASLIPTIFSTCSQTGEFAPGEYNRAAADPDLAVSGQLWWAASNWRNRISVPLSFSPSASVCNVVNGNGATTYVYGSEAMSQATQQWAPHFCLNPKLFTLRHVQTSEVQAKNLLAVGNVDAALQGMPPDTPFPQRVVQAPAAVTGFAIAYSVDGANGEPYPTLKLDARLLAKLLTESYQTCALNCLNSPQLKNNPIDISRDPEFQALNPGIPPTRYLEAASTLAVMSSDSDVMTALTSYINADPEARDWLDGKPDPWGMEVNPAYWKIELPVANWPLLDTHLRQFSAGANPCLGVDPVPWLPLVAAPLSNPATIALDLQFDISNSQVNCVNPGLQTQKLTAVGREDAGDRFLLGLVALGDAKRYELSSAQLETQSTATGSSEFVDDSGRSFVGPTDDALRAAAHLMQPDDAKQTWTLNYNTLRTADAGAAAYPGTMLMSIDVPTEGLDKPDAQRYGDLLRFVAGPGQSPGLEVGQLPPGYLPLTAANGLQAMSAYTARAATSVDAQIGELPLPSGKVLPGKTPTTPPPPPTTPGGEPSSGRTSQPAGITPPGDDGGVTPNPTGTPQPSASSSPTPSTSSSVQLVSAITPTTRPGALALALPMLAIGALACALLWAWFSGTLTRVRGAVRRR